MKALYFFIISLLFSLIASGGYAQCTIDSSNTAAGIYPDTLPAATAGLPYNVDVTFVMVTDTLGLTIYNYQIAGVTGLPVGITWQCNNSANGCNYDPSVSLFGCVNLTGTPVVPGNFTMTVTVIADVQLVGTQNINFDVPLTVLPGTVSNPGFAMTNATGCAPLTVDFINNNPGQLSYLWEFGNGLQSTLENPPSQTYTSAGAYVVTQTVTPNTTPSWYLTEITVTSIPNNYGGILDDPDMYFLLYDPQGTEVYDSRPAINGTFPPVTWGVPNILLSNGNYTVHVWDEDGGLFGADDDLGAITFAGNGSSGSATGTVSGASGLLIVDYTIFQTPVVPLVATDTIYVYDSPAVPVISSAGPLTVCENDTVILTVSDTVNQVQWYESNMILIGETSTSLMPSASGSYSVIVTTVNGCTNASTAQNIVINPLPLKPSFFVNGNVFTTGVTGLNLQWYLNGVAIPGATGSTYTAGPVGTYRLCGTDSNGCENCSDTLYYAGVGLNESIAGIFNVFPNPGNGNFTIDFPTDQQGKREFLIYDLQGRLIDRADINNQKTFYYQKKLQTGVYMLEVHDKTGVYYRRLVVN